MLLEFDADQRLWQSTVRDALGKQCPPSLVSGVAEDGVDPSPVWKSYVEQGWTEMNDPETAVELAIVLEELGRATDPTPFLATMSQFAPLAGDRFDPQESGTAVYAGVMAYRDGDGWVLDGTARHVLDGDRAEWFAVVTDAGVFLVAPMRWRALPGVEFGVRSGAARRRPDLRRVAPARHRPARRRRRAGASCRPDGDGDHDGRCLPAHLRPGSRPCPQPPPVRSADRLVPGRTAQGRRHARRGRTGAGAGYFAALTIAGDDPRRRLAAAMAKAAAGECQSLVFRHGLQLFGAMGFTWENDLQFALKRAKAGELMLGGTAEHRARVTEEYRAAHL